VNFFNRLASHFSWQRNKPQKRTFVTWQNSCRNACTDFTRNNTHRLHAIAYRRSGQVETAVNPLVAMRQDHVSCVINSLTGNFNCTSKDGSHFRNDYCLHFISELATERASTEKSTSSDIGSWCDVFKEVHSTQCFPEWFFISGETPLLLCVMYRL